MSVLFALYFGSFVMIAARKRAAATALLLTATLGSIGMFLHHVDSSLNLNF